jgi:hypothetical protein
MCYADTRGEGIERDTRIEANVKKLSTHKLIKLLFKVFITNLINITPSNP